MEQVSGILQSIGSNLPLEKLLLAAGTLLLCLLGRRYILILFDRVLLRMSKVDPALHSMLRTIMRIALLFLSIMIAFNVLGVPISSFLAVFSVIGLAISLAVQGVLKNFAGGIILLGSKPFSLGDYIETESVSGTVAEISLLYTRLIAPDGRTIYIPNDSIYSSRLINYSSNGARRMELKVGVSYDNTPDQVRTAALEAVSGIQGILADPAPVVFLERYDDSSICYTIQAWAPSESFLKLRYSLNESIYSSFKAHGVEITYPHLNVHNSKK